jgi:hypothetical protein
MLSELPDLLESDDELTKRVDRFLEQLGQLDSSNFPAAVLSHCEFL